MSAKISALTALAGADVAAADLLPIVDTSATTTKKITWTEFLLAAHAAPVFTGISQFSVGASSRWYNLGSDADANYERARASWVANIFTFVTEAGGTGSVREFEIGYSGGSWRYGQSAYYPAADDLLSLGLPASRVKHVYAIRVLSAQGADVVAANNLALGVDGNCFNITGNTQINLITGTNWSAGAEVTLLFAGTPTVKHGQATSGANLQILLAGATDFVASANDVLTLVLWSDNIWREKSRTVI